MRLRLAGRFKLAVEGGAETEWFDNLITNGGLDQIALGDYLTWCVLGTGTTPASVTDTALAEPLSASNNLTSSVIVAGQITVVFSFPSGTATGTITEVGMCWMAEGTPLFSRALLPEALVVRPSQGVTVTYELNLIPPEADDEYQIDINGTTITCTARAAYVGNGSDWAWGLPGTRIEFVTLGPHAPQIYDGGLGTVDAFPLGTSYPCTSSSDTIYTPTVPHSVWLTVRWGASVTLEAVPTTLVHTNGYGAYQIGFDPPITKPPFNTLCLNYQLSWSRYEPAP